MEANSVPSNPKQLGEVHKHAGEFVTEGLEVEHVFPWRGGVGSVEKGIWG